jgi:Na+/melibiose symporter-like transporter
MEEQKPIFSKYAAVAMIFGIISFFNLFGLEKAIAAIIFAVLGFKEIEKHQPALKGKGMSMAGIILGAVYLLLFIILIIFRRDIIFATLNR